MEWANPYAFILFAPLFLVIFYIYWQKNKLRPSLRFSSLNELKKIPVTSLRKQLIFLPQILKILAISLAIIALARPQTSDTKEKKNVDGVDIMIALDISDSMLIEDMQPENRLESAKKVVEDFVLKRENDRIGLVVFGGESYTRVPLTTDYNILLKSIREISTASQFLKQGTAIGVALANAVARIKDSTAKSRVIILLTDGENNSGIVAPEAALEIAKGYGIKTYTIGLGIDGETRLPVTVKDVFGRTQKSYQPFTSRVNDQLLQQIATDTGGKYYRASKTKALENVFNDINKLEKSKIEVSQYTRYTELYQKFLFWSILFYALAVLLNKTYLRSNP